MAELESAAGEIADAAASSESTALEMMDTLSELVNQSAESLGLQIEIKELTQEERKDSEKVSDKLVEIDAKLSAIKESIAQDEIVVKTYFESE